MQNGKLQSLNKQVDVICKIPPATSGHCSHILCHYSTTDIAAVTCGRDFLSSLAHSLLDTLMRLLQLMKPGVFPKLKVCVSEHTVDIILKDLNSLYHFQHFIVKLLLQVDADGPV